MVNLGPPNITLTVGRLKLRSTGNTNSNTSEAIPHLSILGSGTNAVDTYQFTATAGAHGIFDIDFAHNVSAIYLDTVLALRDTSGNLLALNDDSPISYGAGGSVGPYDSYLEYTFGAAGTYRLEVWKYNHGVAFVVLNGFGRPEG